MRRDQHLLCARRLIVGRQARGEGPGARDEGRGTGIRVSLPSPQAARRLLIALLALAFVAACAEAPKRYPARPTPKKPPVSQPTTPAPVPPAAQRANVRPSTQDAVTPQRQASMKLVAKGKELLDAREPERAAAVLMDAVNVDASNGVAYYYLAVANERMGQHDVALGLCDKAEALLGADQTWLVRINQIRGGVDEPTKPTMIQSPIDAAF